MEISAQIIDKRVERNLVPVDFEITDWEALKIYFDQLVAMDPQTTEELGHFLKQISELEAIVKEDMAWRYIRMTCDTENEELRKRYQYFVEEILPHLSVYEDQLNRKIAGHPHFHDLDRVTYLTYTRSLVKQIELFREENIPLISQAQMTSQQYGATVGSMSISHKGETMTLQQAARILEDKDRELRESVWRKVGTRRAEDAEKIHGILDKLIELRTQMAKNSGFTYFSEYIFPQLGRFDYQPEDTLAFHHAVEMVAKPVYLELMEERKQLLGVDKLRPWDLSVDIFGEEPLAPFKKVEDLISHSTQMLGNLNPVLGTMIQQMAEKGFLDLESRMGKAPGGYNYPLAETGVPFIFMNATGSQADVTTMLHESGHAVHAYLTHELSLNAFKDTPSEVAELASMTMELLTLDYYHYMYPEEEKRKRAIKEQLVRCIMIFPWIATVDAFQKWL
ncbi:MAG: M3 family metallopeptidase, partial [Bacteroidota bacterium]